MSCLVKEVCVCLRDERVGIYKSEVGSAFR